MRVIVRQRFNKEMTVCLSKQLSRETGAPRSTLEGWKAFLWSPNYLILKSFLEPNFIFLILQQRTEIISRTEKCNHCCKMNRLLLFVKLESIDRSTVDQYDLDIDRSQMMCTSCARKTCTSRKATCGCFASRFLHLHLVRFSDPPAHRSPGTWTAGSIVARLVCCDPRCSA